MELFRRGTGIEKISFSAVEMTLVATGDGTEIVHEKISAGKKVHFAPEEGLNALEAIIVLSGALRWFEHDVVLGPGDSFVAHPVTEHCTFEADEDTELFYVTSRPMYEQLIAATRTMADLAREVEQKDGYTADHCDRIKDLATAVGKEMHLTTKQMYDLNVGSFLHDVGKVRVPESILGKPGPLSAEEWAIMRQHPTFGRQMLEETRLTNLTLVAPIVEQHHERWDGTGYPLGLKGEEILVQAAIVAVVDCYDAMTTDRPYREALPKEVALEEISRGRGTQFRPDVVDAFMAVTKRLL